MAVLEKIRVKLGILISVLIAVALLSFIIDPDTLQSAISTFSSKWDVGEVNNKSITYQDYQKRVDYFTNIYQLTTGNQSFNEETQDAVYNTAWQDMISEMLLLPTIAKAGIRVGVEEMFDMTQGREISPIIANDPTFAGPNGEFSREQFYAFVSMINQDQSGNLQAYWDFLENNIKQTQLFSKYVSLIEKSTILTPVEMRRAIEDNNYTASFDFVMKPVSYQLDSTIVVTHQEVKDFYNKNIKNYKQEASRDIEYVVFEIVPSYEDIEYTREQINKVYDEFVSTTNLQNFLARNSDLPFQKYFYKEGELVQIADELEEFAFGNKKRLSVLPVFQQENVFIAARVSDKKRMSDSAYVQHILLPATEKTKADSLLKVLRRGGDFSQLASQYSIDQNPNLAPGEIGWMTQMAMVQGMDTVLQVAANKPFILNTLYGIHIVNVKERTKPLDKVQMAILTKETVASKRTFQDYYSQANSLVSRSEGKYENFSKIANEEGLGLTPAYGIKEGAKKISRFNNVKELSRWAYEAKRGEVSPIITVDNQYFFIASVVGIREEGIAPLAQVESIINQTLRHEKQMKVTAERLKKDIEGLTNLQAVADVIGTSVSSHNDLAFGSMSSYSLDPVLVGSVAGAKDNSISDPVVGNIGIYVFQIKDRQVGSYYTEDDANMRLRQKAGYQMNIIPNILMDLANVKDNRARFF